MFRLVAFALAVVMLAACGADSTAYNPMDDAELGLSNINPNVGFLGEPVGGTLLEEEPSFGLPGTNALNYANGDGYALLVTAELDSVFIDLVKPGPGTACFEYRVDNQLPIPDAANPNPDVADGLWPTHCVQLTRLDDGTLQSTFPVSFGPESFVDIRLTHGRFLAPAKYFDWTRFYTMVEEVADEPQHIDDCKNGGFAAFGFRNQGQCIQYVNTGKDKR